MTTIGTIRVPTSVSRSAGLADRVYLSTRLDEFLRDPGPGDPSYIDVLTFSDGTAETVGCVGETYDDRLYDALWMFRAATIGVPRGIRTRKLIYGLRMNGERIMLAAIAERTGVTIMLPDEDHASRAA